MGCKKICKIFASELGSESWFMRGFQKGITLGGWTSGGACKVTGRWWVGGNLDFSVYLSPLRGKLSRTLSLDIFLDIFPDIYLDRERGVDGGERRGRHERGREEKGEERDCDNWKSCLLLSLRHFNL